MTATLYITDEENQQMNQTTFALKYFPMSALSESQQRNVIFNRYAFLQKMQIEELCNEDKNRLFYSTEPHQDSARSTWKIVWANNNMPTLAAWKATPQNRTLKVELRVTRAWGRVAILSFVNGTPLFTSGHI